MTTAEDSFDFYNRLRAFVGFDASDEARLKAIGPLLVPEQPRITDQFYEAILGEPETAAFVEGRVEELKKTHARWFTELFSGVYDQTYFTNRWAIGKAHVRIGLSPRWVDLVFTIILQEVSEALTKSPVEDPEAARRSMAKILELDRAVIQLAYDEDRLDRLSDFTGMKRALIENVVRIAR